MCCPESVRSEGPWDRLYIRTPLILSDSALGSHSSWRRETREPARVYVNTVSHTHPHIHIHFHTHTLTTLTHIFTVSLTHPHIYPLSPWGLAAAISPWSLQIRRRWLIVHARRQLWAQLLMSPPNSGLIMGVWGK